MYKQGGLLFLLAAFAIMVAVVTKSFSMGVWGMVLLLPVYLGMRALIFYQRIPQAHSIQALPLAEFPKKITNRDTPTLLQRKGDSPHVYAFSSNLLQVIRNANGVESVHLFIDQQIRRMKELAERRFNSVRLGLYGYGFEALLLVGISCSLRFAKTLTTLLESQGGVLVLQLHAVSLGMSVLIAVLALYALWSTGQSRMRKEITHVDWLQATVDDKVVARLSIKPLYGLDDRAYRGWTTSLAESNQQMVDSHERLTQVAGRNGELTAEVGLAQLGIQRLLSDLIEGGLEITISGPIHIRAKKKPAEDVGLVNGTPKIGPPAMVSDQD